MALSRADAEARLEQLRAGLAQAIKDRDEAAARVVATDGAIQDCEWFLAQLDPETPQEPE